MSATGSLKGKVALVAGATRGAGRGIATALGEQGATVWCTGRTSRDGGKGMGRPETIEGTAERVTAAGGEGIPMRVDHLDEGQVRRLVERIGAESGRLDILVNDIWGGDPLTQWGKPFWELDVEKGQRMLRTAIDTHVITARHAVPLLLGSQGGLVVEVTDGDGFWYRGNLFYDLVKTTVVRLAFAMAEELKPHGVACVAVTPGFLRSEAVLDHFGVTEATWREAIAEDPNFAASETPLLAGRAVAQLAGDPDVRKRTGRIWSSWGLAREFGLCDADGSRPDWGAHFVRRYGPIVKPADDRYWAYWEGYRTLWDAIQADGTLDHQLEEA